METFGSCSELNWSQGIALDTQSLSSICTGDTAVVIVPSSRTGGIPARCTARLLGRMERPDQA